MSDDVRRVNSDFPQCECVFDDDGGDFAVMPWEEYEHLRAELARFEYKYREWLDLADSLNCELVEAKEEIERLRAEVVLKTAEAEGAGSLLLDVQQECIDLRARGEELEKQLKIAEGERDITLKHYIGAMDKIMGVDTS